MRQSEIHGRIYLIGCCARNGSGGVVLVLFVSLCSTVRSTEDVCYLNVHFYCLKKCPASVNDT